MLGPLLDLIEAEMNCVISGGSRNAVADPGFPRGGGANSPGGRQHTILPKFPKNCMKLKEFGPPEGGGLPSHPL